jgi:hypothetical protein
MHASPSRIAHGLDDAEPILQASGLWGNIALLNDQRHRLSAMLWQNLRPRGFQLTVQSCCSAFVTKRFEHVNAGICRGSVDISTRSDISTRYLRQEQPTEKEACRF